MIDSNAKVLTANKSGIEADLIEKLEPVVAELGYECRDVEVYSGGQACVRVIIDAKKDATGNRAAISIEDCAKVHRVVGPMFDVWDPIPGSYSLEMSSGGECPPLRSLEHFQEALGQRIRFQTTEAIPVPPPAKPRKNWEGILESIAADSGLLRLRDGQELFEVPLSKVRNATWLRQWSVQDLKGQE